MTSELPESGSNSDDICFQISEDNEGPGVSTDQIDDTSLQGTEIFSKRSAALFLLKTREERRVTQTSLNGIIQDLRGFWRDALENLKVCLFAEWFPWG